MAVQWLARHRIPEVTLSNFGTQTGSLEVFRDYLIAST
jgi:hypothetical protein